MKIALLIISLITTFISYSQHNQYYTTDGKNRMSYHQLTKELERREKKFAQLFGIDVHFRATIEKSETINQTIISTLKIGFIHQELDGMVVMKPLDMYMNREFPIFNLNHLGGKNINSEQLKGKPTLVYMWSTNCDTCVDDIELMNDYQALYKNEMNFVAITKNTKRKVEKFLNKTPFNFIQLTDAKSFINQLKISSYPVILILDQEGIVRDVSYGIFNNIGKLKK